MAAVISAMLSFNSCNAEMGIFNETTCKANLTCYYAGGLPSASSHQVYELDKRLSDKQIEDIFFELCSVVQPGFTTAVLELNFYDWMDNYKYTSVYDFWWETTNPNSGDGYYAWDERMEK